MGSDGMVDSSYLRMVYEPRFFQKLIPRAKRLLKKIQKATPFNAMAFTGTSGASVAYPLSYLTGIPLLCVRKESGHSCLEVEGWIGAKNFLIVDDQISSGDTIRKILSKVRGRTQAECVGVLLFLDERVEGASLDWIEPKLPVYGFDLRNSLKSY